MGRLIPRAKHPWNLVRAMSCVLLAGCNGAAHPSTDRSGTPTQAPNIPIASPGRPSPGRPGPGGGVYSPQSTEAVEMLLAWRDGDEGALQRARSQLEQATARTPGDTWLQMLLAWTWHADGDPAREAQAVAALPEDRRPAYQRLFARDTAEVVAALRYRAWDGCRVERGIDCPAAPPRPSEWPVFEQVAWFSHSADRVERWRPDAGGMDAFLDAIGAAPGARIADVGAGEGYFTLPIARAVGPTGRVVATEVDPVFTTFIEAASRDLGLANVTTVVQRTNDIGLAPSSVDIVLMCEVFKAIVTNASAGDPAQVERHVTPFLASVERALAPGGRLVVVDHDAPESVPRAISPETVRRLLEAAGFRRVARDERWAPMEVVQTFARPTASEGLDGL